MTRQESLAKVSKDLLLKNPFYGIFLIMLNKQWSNHVPTAGVGKNGIGYQLYINEAFWASLADLHRSGLLQHELMHIAFGHLTEFDYMKNQEVANIAMDLEINQYIEPANLPPNGQVLSLYPELKLEAKKGSDYYYDKLMQAVKNNTCPQLNAQIGQKGMITVNVPGLGNVNIQISDHGTWEEFGELSEAERKLIQKQVEHILKEVADQVQKSRGTIPGEFAELIKRLQNPEPPKFDWKGYLRRFVGGSNKVLTKKTRRKDSRRYEGSPGLKIKYKRRILVGIDTSGSVRTDELKEFVGELHHMTKTGTEIMVAQSDAAISDISEFDPKVDFKVKGRGGTDFTPLVNYYNENKRKFSCLIYFTDGLAPAPENNPQGKMLWVLSSTATMNENLPGHKIKLNG